MPTLTLVIVAAAQISTLLADLVGITLGVAAAVGSAVLDSVLSRINDAFLSIPSIMMALVVIAAIGSTIPILIILTGLIYASAVFRIARSLGLGVVVSDFVETVRVRGEGLWWIITREILPNLAMPMATDFGLRFVYVILFISSLSFLGLGVQPPQSDWGSMVRESLGGLPCGAIAPLVPALAIATLTVAINLIVDANVIERLKRLRKQTGVSFVFISHDLSTIASFADEIVVLYAGRVVEQGKTDQVLSPPYHPYTRLLIASVPELRIGWLDETMETQEAQAGIERVVKLTDIGCPFFDRCPLAIEGTCDLETPPIRSLGGGHTIECHRSEEEFVSRSPVDDWRIQGLRLLTWDTPRRAHRAAA